ncbi:MAG: hypothetical protein U0325_03115 [Polyangiales bacterium]
MTFRTAATRFGWTMMALASLGAASCVGPGDDLDDPTADPDEIVGANAVARRATVQSYVLLPTNASDDAIARAILTQMRPMFGALKAEDIGLGRRLDASDALAQVRAVTEPTWQRDTVDVVDPANPMRPATQLLRVRFTYTDTAVVPKTQSARRAISTTALFGDYAAHGNEIVQSCQGEHQDWGASGIWYNFEPRTSACASLIGAEATRISAQRRALSNADRQVTVDEAARWFTPISVRLSTVARTETKYPDYHRLFDDNRLVIGSYFGADKLDDPNDYGARNFFAYIQTVLRARPELRVTASSPTANLGSVTWRGATLTATPEQVAGWIVNSTGYPTQVSATDRAEFRNTVIRQWRDKLITFSASASLTEGGRTRDVTLEVRVFYGDEESVGSGAVQRYQRAFQEVDVFQYTGHSHLGAGPLDGRNYAASSFPNRYQVLMVNSCVSFNYYNRFFDMHPGGTRNLDTVTNGLPVFLEGSGTSSGRFAVAFLDGRWRSYLDVLTGMKIDLPWERGHDANRVADGESDNEFTPTRNPMTLRVSAATP